MTRKFPFLELSQLVQGDNQLQAQPFMMDLLPFARTLPVTAP